MASDPRATRAAAEISRINAFFPIMTILGNRLAASRPFEGKTIAMSGHLTTLTGALIRELALGGGEWIVCSANDATTDHGVVQMLRDNNITVYTLGNRNDAYRQALTHKPNLIADVGADIMTTLAKEQPELSEHVQGAVEVTRSGVSKLRALDSLPFGVVNINDGKLKPAIEDEVASLMMRIQVARPEAASAGDTEGADGALRPKGMVSGQAGAQPGVQPGGPPRLSPAQVAELQRRMREQAARKAMRQQVPASSAFDMMKRRRGPEPAPAKQEEEAKAATKAPEAETFEGVGRNDPCPCGSGKKFKKCHGSN